MDATTSSPIARRCGRAAGTSSRKARWTGKHLRGRRFGATMRDIAGLLERKRALLDLRQKAEPEQFAKIEHDLREIDETLTRLESKEAPATPPH